MFTTVPVFKDCMQVIMEQMPKGMKSEDIKNDLLAIKGVRNIADFHCWALAGGKNVLTAHIYLTKSSSDVNHRVETHRVYHEAVEICKKKNICHVTLQIL